MEEDQFLFKELTEAEIAEYKKQVRENYQVGNEINPLWHPVYQEECHLMNEEAGLYPDCPGKRRRNRNRNGCGGGGGQQQRRHRRRGRN
jgi:hypothetical protein